MEGFTKLFRSITTSTIWQEDAEICKIWITLLALADQNGFVDATIPGLAHEAHISLDVCQKALQKFLSPDPYSRTKDNDGRRIQEVDGGWILLNHSKYRRKRHPEDRRAYMRDYMANYRSVNNSVNNVNNVNNVNLCKPPLAQAEAEAEAEAEDNISCPTEAVRLSEMLLTLILRRKPDYKKPNIQNWARHIDYLLRLDRRAAAEIETVIKWCQSDSFWQNNILSTEKLRKQYDQLVLKMKAANTLPTKQKLFPIAGKICSKCKLPAVYKSTGGSYDFYYCLKHSPEEVKKLYT